MTDKINFDNLGAATKAIDAIDIDALLAEENATEASGGRKTHLPPDARAGLKDAITAATSTPEATSPPSSVGAQAEAIAAAAGEALDPEMRTAIGKIEEHITDLAAAVNAASPAEQAAMRDAMLHPDAATPVPDSAATRKVQGILGAIDAATRSIEAPHKMRHYGAMMAARPVAETAKLGLEAGILSLLGTSLLQAFGVSVEPYSALHAATYAVSAGGVGLLNLTTISDRILRPAAEGSVRPLYQKHGSGASFLRGTSSVGRLALLGVSVVAGIGVAQKTISTTYESSRIAGGIAAPLDAFTAKKAVFEQRLGAFAAVPDKILEIAAKIEAGKLSSDGKKYVPWPKAEKDALIAELRPLFEKAGLNPSLVDSIAFNEPKDLGFGKAAKLKAALRTGNTSDLPDLKAYTPESIAKLERLAGAKLGSTAEYVIAIRAKMGLSGADTFEKRVSDLIKNFLASPAFQTININLEKAQKMAGLIKRQGEDVVATGERAFLHGAAPIGPEAVIPFARAIVETRADVNKAADTEVVAKIREMFGTMSEALKVAGATVDLATPTVDFDTADVESLSKFLEDLVRSKAAGSVTTETTSSAVAALAETFIPGGKKWEDTRQWLAVHLMQSAGYFVTLEGSKLRVYEPTRKAAPREAADFSLVQTIGRYYEEWYAYLSGTKPPSEWNLPKADLDKMNNKDLGAGAREKLEDLAAGSTRMVVTEGPHVSVVTPRSLTDEQIGAIAREQVDVQHALGKKPIIIPPAVWDSIKRGVPPPSATKVDMSEWRELSPDATQKLVSQFESAASWRASLYLTGGVGTLILGVLLLSLYPVYRLNRKLRAAAPDFEEELGQAETAMAEALDTVNDALAALPGFETLPRMDTEMLRAAIRLAGEETSPAVLAEKPSLGTEMWHTIKEAFSRGPYAYRVEEIMAFGELIERLQTDSAMQKRLMDIIAPGASSAEQKLKTLKKLPTKSARQAGRPSSSRLFEDMHPASAEVFRNTLRGNLGFRIAVLEARREVLAGTAADAAEDEIASIDTQLAQLKPLLARLDADDLFYRMTTEYREPNSLTTRSKAQERADTRPQIAISVTPDMLPKRRFSVQSGIARDIRRRYANRSAATSAT